MSLYRIYGKPRGEHSIRHLGTQDAENEEQARARIRKAWPGARIERVELAIGGAPAPESDDAFTVRERTDRYGHIYDVVSVHTGAIVRDGVGGTRHALTFASQSAACEWARWLNDGKPELTRSSGAASRLS